MISFSSRPDGVLAQFDACLPSATSSRRSLADPVSEAMAAVVAAISTTRSGSGSAARAAACRVQNTPLSRRADSGAQESTADRAVGGADEVVDELGLCGDRGDEVTGPEEHVSAVVAGQLLSASPTPNASAHRAR